MERWAGIWEPIFLEVFTNSGCRTRGWEPKLWQGTWPLLRVGKTANLWELVRIKWQNWRLKGLRSQWKREAEKWACYTATFSRKTTSNFQSYMWCEAKRLNRMPQKMKTSCLDVLRSIWVQETISKWGPGEYQRLSIGTPGHQGTWKII